MGQAPSVREGNLELRVSSGRAELTTLELQERTPAGLAPLPSQ